MAVKVLKKQGIEVKALSFKSYFFDSKQAEKAAKELRIPLKVVDFSKEHLRVVKKPKYGYGKAMNPCIDCHVLMLKKAKEVMEKDYNPPTASSHLPKGKWAPEFDFVATGEVLGERPMSQNKKALELIEKESSLRGYLLRPLSAKLLKQTVSEENGSVDRQSLLDIFGRSRKRQIELAGKWRISRYPTPAGGCLLTDLEFGKRLKELLKNYPQSDGNDVELLKLGRHFWQEKIKIVIGREHEENVEIRKLAKRGDFLIEMQNYAGPTTLIRNYYKKKKISKNVLEKAKFLTQQYSKKARYKEDIKFKLEKKQGRMALAQNFL